MAHRRILVISPRQDLLGSVLFSLEAEGYDVAGVSALPRADWLKRERFAATVIDQAAFDRSDAEAVAFCIRAHPVVLMAERPNAHLTEWVSRIIVLPDDAEGLTSALEGLLITQPALN